jgi:hypothetical protein
MVYVGFTKCIVIIINRSVSFPSESDNYDFTNVRFFGICILPSVYRFSIRLWQSTIISRLNSTKEFGVGKERIIVCIAGGSGYVVINLGTVRVETTAHIVKNIS